MKKFAYYPGCSLETMAASYHVSAVETAAKLGVDLVEIRDWNCCGATYYSHIDELLAQTLCARNLAIAEEQQLDMVAPCSGCYKNHYVANAHLKGDPDLAEHLNWAMEEDGLHYSGTIEVHHLMQVFANDVGVDEIKRRVKRPLKDLRVAAYYGCHATPPSKNGSEVGKPTAPRLFEDLISALGATPLQYPFRMRCCGGSLIATNRKAALGMLDSLLQGAIDAGADVIATACPLCQINLECYQSEINREFEKEMSVPIMYFTQLMGLALGIGQKRLGIGRELVPITPVLACMRGK
jgi:heterodisulfide reductase subunit B